MKIGRNFQRKFVVQSVISHLLRDASLCREIAAELHNNSAFGNWENITQNKNRVTDYSLINYNVKF